MTSLEPVCQLGASDRKPRELFTPF
jgi:hypothetical protein